MLTRDWILETLLRLPVWTWPVFLFEVWAVERYYRAYRAANPVGMLGVGVTLRGRIVITLQASGEAEPARDWTVHAPRAPWLQLAQEAGFSASVTPPQLHCFCTLPAPVLHRFCPLGPARPLAPP
jgi:hypothetical protein